MSCVTLDFPLLLVGVHGFRKRSSGSAFFVLGTPKARTKMCYMNGYSQSQPERPGDTVCMSFSIPRSLAAVLQAEANAKGQTRSALIREAIKAVLDTP